MWGGAEAFAQKGAANGCKVDVGAGGKAALHAGEHTHLTPQGRAIVSHDADEPGECDDDDRDGDNDGLRRERVAEATYGRRRDDIETGVGETGKDSSGYGEL